MVGKELIYVASKALVPSIRSKLWVSFNGIVHHIYRGTYLMQSPVGQLVGGLNRSMTSTEYW